MRYFRKLKEHFVKREFFKVFKVLKMKINVQFFKILDEYFLIVTLFNNGYNCYHIRFHLSTQ